MNLRYVIFNFLIIFQVKKFCNFNIFPNWKLFMYFRRINEILIESFCSLHKFADNRVDGSCVESSTEAFAATSCVERRM